MIFENVDLIEMSDPDSEFLKIVFYSDVKKTEDIQRKSDHETTDFERSDQRT